jgi:hypothetical protein
MRRAEAERVSMNGVALTRIFITCETARNVVACSTLIQWITFIAARSANEKDGKDRHYIKALDTAMSRK